jgi:dTDP-4-amino-4,6-dideoxygalactose transaminase
MRVPLLDLGEQYRILAQPISQAIDEVLRSQRFILGPKVEGFERAICDYTGAGFAVGMSSGTDAILAILMALGIGRGDAVVTTPYTFFSTAGCIARVGATPLFVDIDEKSFNLSPRLLEEFLQSKCKPSSVDTTCDGKKIRAIVPVHLFGLCSQMDEICTLAENYRLPIIEDAAQAIGAEYPGRSGVQQAGTMGLAGSFSFYPSKNLGAAGDAGLVVTNDESLARGLRVYRNHGMEPRYFHQMIGGNFRLDEIQAAILSVKLPHLDEWSARRRAVADIYREEFARAGLLEKIALPSDPFRDRGLKKSHIYHQFTIRAPERDALREHLQRNEIDSDIYYPLGLHEQKCFKYLGYKRGDFPATERVAAETLALPIYPELPREAQCFVVEKIAEFYAR